LDSSLIAIENTGGFRLPRHAPQFTEAAEAFHLDREMAMVEASDASAYAKATHGYATLPVAAQVMPEPVALRRAA